MTNLNIGISINDMLATPPVKSATDLLNFLRSRPNEFFTKKMLITEHGFSSNIGKNLTNLVTNNPNMADRLWSMTSIDLTNPKNKKQQTFFSHIAPPKLDKATLNALLERCMMTDYKPKKLKKLPKS